MTTLINTVMNAIGAALFGALSPFCTVLVILVLALLTAAGSLIVFKWTSDQEAIRAGKGPMKAHLLGVLIFRHDLRMVFRSLGRSFLRSITNMRFLLVPLLVMIVPLVLLFVQFDLRLAARGLEPGDSAVLRILVADGESLDAVDIEVPNGLVRETPGVRIHHRAGEMHEVDFRIGAVSAGAHEIVVRHRDWEATKVVHVSGNRPLLSPVRPGPGLLDGLLAPGEKALPEESPFTLLEIAYPDVTVPFLGIDWAWWVLFLVLMILGLFVLRCPLGVDF